MHKHISNRKMSKRGRVRGGAKWTAGGTAGA